MPLPPELEQKRIIAVLGKGGTGRTTVSAALAVLLSERGRRVLLYQANSKDQARACGLVQSNDLGLFEMLGNVYEWCQDPYGCYQPGEEVPKNTRLLRGGSFDSPLEFVRSAFRGGDAPSGGISYYGFRPARTYQ